MRTRLALLAGAVALVALFETAGAPARPATSLPRSALVPNAVGFFDRRHGVLGTGWEGCANRASHCRLQGTISVTSNGGKTWRVVRRTMRPVVAVTFFHDAWYVELDNGSGLVGRGTSWQKVRRMTFLSTCPKNWSPGLSADIVDTNIGQDWSICTGQPGAGNEAKAVYRYSRQHGTHRVSYTPMTGRHPPGAISSYGYAAGIAGSFGGFAIVWESRGTLYVTRDGGHRWIAEPKVARPEVDFGDWADVGAGTRGTAFVLLSIGGSEKRRLIEMTDAGRTWHVVHRWR